MEFIRVNLTLTKPHSNLALHIIFCNPPYSRLLGMVKERIIILSDPLPSELAMAMEHGFKVGSPNTPHPQKH